MNKLVAVRLSRRLRQVNRKLKEKGFELIKRQAYMIEPMSRSMIRRPWVMRQSV